MAYYLLLYLQWTGLLVEPNPDFHAALYSKLRNAWILPHCLSTTTTPIIVDFNADLLLSGIIGNAEILFKYCIGTVSIKVCNIKSNGI